MSRVENGLAHFTSWLFFTKWINLLEASWLAHIMVYPGTEMGWRMHNDIKKQANLQCNSDVVNIQTAFETSTTVKAMAENKSKQIVKNKAANTNKFEYKDELVEDLMKYF